MKVTPTTRRWVVAALAGIALASIVAEVLILWTGKSTSEALLTIAATAVGGLAGLAIPGEDSEPTPELALRAEPTAPFVGDDLVEVITGPDAPETDPYREGTEHDADALPQWSHEDEDCEDCDEKEER